MAASRSRSSATPTSLFTSAIKRGSDAGQAISVNVSGRSQLRLVVANGGDGTDSDHADWADAKLACGAAGGNTPPVPTIASPAATFTWHVGETISFSGSATDAEDGTIGASGLDWSIVLFHCGTDGCHSHAVEDFPDRASGSMAAPDHDYPSYLEVRLTATDSGGASTDGDAADRSRDGRPDLYVSPVGPPGHRRQHDPARPRSPAP